MRRASLAALTLAASAGIPAAQAQQMQSGLLRAPQQQQQVQQAQAQGPGSSLVATISQSAVADSNYNLDDPSPGTSYYGDTRLALDYLRQTETQSLGLGIDTGLRPLWQAGEAFEVVLASPSNAYFDYEQEGADTAFDANFRLRSRRVDYLGPLDDTGALPDDLSPFQEDATEFRSDANVGFTLGTNSPSTYEFRVLATNFDYSEDINTANSLVPRRSIEGQGLWTLAITPVFSTAVFGDYYYYNSDVPTEDELRVAEGEVGLVYEPSEIFRLRGGVGYADRNREQTNVNTGERSTTQHDTGLTVRGDFRYNLPQWVVLGEARWTAAAPSGTRLSGFLNAVYTLPRGLLTGRVYQRYGGGQGGDEVRITGATVGLTHDINEVSRFDIDASYAVQVNEDVPEDPNIDRTDFIASYIYDFTENISGQVGYGYRHRIEDPDDADSHRLFVVIGRTFETGL
jgi:hypothetical protein